MLRFQSFRRVALWFGLLATMLGCRPIARLDPQPQSIHATELHWKTDGGGQIEFAIVQQGAMYEVTVTAYQFAERPAHFVVTEEDKEVHNALGRVLASQEGIELITSMAPSGSWTTIVFKNDEASTTYPHLMVENDLRIIYAAVVARLTPQGETNSAPTLLAAETLPADETSMATLWSLTASADCRRMAYLVQQDQHFFVVIDGQTREGPYQAVDLVQFSLDGRHYAYPATNDNVSFFVVDGQPGQPYDAVRSLTLSADGEHTAYVAVQGGQTWVVVDGQAEPVDGELLDAGRSYQRFPQPSLQFNRAVVELSADGQHVAYAVKAGDAQFVVLDGQPGQAHQAISAASLQFSSDGARLAYVASADGQQFVVVNGQAGQRYDAVEATSLKFSPDGQHLAYVARASEQAFVVLDEQTGPPYAAVPVEMTPPVFGPGYFQWHDVLRFSADSQRLAYMAATEAGEVLVVDGVASPPATHIAAFLFSPDNQHVAYVAQRDRHDFVVIDGQESQAFDAQSTALVFSPDSRHTAITAYRNGDHLLLVDGQTRATERPIRSVVFRPDSQSVVYTAEVGEEGAPLFAVVAPAAAGPPFNEVWCGPFFDAAARFYYLALKYGAPTGEAGASLRMEVYLVEERLE